MTIDDVVVKTVTLLAIVGVTGAAAWILVPDSLLGPAWIGAAVVGLVLGLIISFSRMANPALVVTYAVVEGVFVGLVSKFFETAYDGIVLQAAVATFGIFFLMAILYRARVIRATPRFVRGIIARDGRPVRAHDDQLRAVAVRRQHRACATAARWRSASAWSASWSPR